MTLPLYAGNKAPSAASTGANAGLWFTRFYNAFSADWTVPSEGKSEWIHSTAKITASPEGNSALESLVERQKTLCASLQGHSTVLTTTAPLATGLGLSHPVENGFAFHPTLGCAYLPASGVKGLLRAWMEVWAETEGDKSVLMKHWFGTSHNKDLKDTFEEDPQKHSAGCLIFFDALPTQWPKLACDIMTPHMGKWYENGGKIDKDNFAATAPADWHSPVPIPFMTVQPEAKFLLAIAPRLTGDAEKDAAARAASANALEQLKLALEWLGAGAKTATGYGRMVRLKADDDAEEEQAKKTALAALTPNMQLVVKLKEACAEALRLGRGKQKINPGGGLYQIASSLSKRALEDESWSAEEKAQLADAIEMHLPEVLTPWDAKEQSKKLKIKVLRGIV